MKHDNRLSATLHALLHMAERGKPMTSAELAMCMDTNPVVVRRTMAGLRKAGYVRSGKGHGGGWEIACDLSAVTLKDVYDASATATRPAWWRARSRTRWPTPFPKPRLC